MTESFLSFRLSEDFISGWRSVTPKFGFEDAGGVALGEIVFLDKYSRLKPDGTKERWWEVCRRVVEGMYSIQKDWAKSNVLPWNDNKAQKSAQEAYELLFQMKWTPPGRGLSAMGTYVVNGRGDSTPLQNCAGISTADMTKSDPSGPFCFLMNVSMLGVGVGYDTRGVEKNFVIYKPKDVVTEYVIPDSREGWVESLRLCLESYLIPNKSRVEFDYSLIRPEGAPIVTFGGVAPGPEPLMKMHRALDKLFAGREGEILSSVDICDIANLVGVCVVSGNVRRSALLAMGEAYDKSFLSLKNPSVFPERNSYNPESPGWAWMSNNSIRTTTGVKVGDDIVDGIRLNGEPGVIWSDVTKNYGRLIDPPNYKDHRFSVFNPCVEQPLESGEMCTLSDIHLSRIDSYYEFERASKYAYLYAKAVTLLPTAIPKTNAIMQRNRRIGISISGVADYLDLHGHAELRDWLDAGYQTIQSYDHIYSEWLCVRESIKTTTVKPTGTVGLIVGESPGAHWSPGGQYFRRAMRLAKTNPLVQLLTEAGYVVEPASESPETTVVAYFDIKSDAKRSERDVSIFEKISLAAELQRWWSDNGVSVTVSFDPEKEGHLIGTVLAMYDGQLKAVSFLPMGNQVYPQQPYTQITSFDHLTTRGRVGTVDLSSLYDGTAGNVVDGSGDRYCTTDVCEIKPSWLKD